MPLWKISNPKTPNPISHTQAQLKPIFLEPVNNQTLECTYSSDFQFSDTAMDQQNRSTRSRPGVASLHPKGGSAIITSTASHAGEANKKKPPSEPINITITENSVLSLQSISQKLTQKTQPRRAPRDTRHRFSIKFIVVRPRLTLLSSKTSIFTLRPCFYCKNHEFGLFGLFGLFGFFGFLAFLAFLPANLNFFWKLDFCVLNLFLLF